eukprot:10173753-Lingulodinium_polyedra.AAC.1
MVKIPCQTHRLQTIVDGRAKNAQAAVICHRGAELVTDTISQSPRLRPNCRPLFARAAPSSPNSMFVFTHGREGASHGKNYRKLAGQIVCRCLIVSR